MMAQPRSAEHRSALLRSELWVDIAPDSERGLPSLVVCQR
jgi:hypothetical protein